MNLFFNIIDNILRGTDSINQPIYYQSGVSTSTLRPAFNLLDKMFPSKNTKHGFYILATL